MCIITYVLLTAIFVLAPARTVSETVEQFVANDSHVVTSHTPVNKKQSSTAAQTDEGNKKREEENEFLPVFTLDEVAKHRTREDIWIVIGSGVYNLSSFLKYHPGGDTPMYLAGKDATAVWHSIHSVDILRRHKNLLIGRIQGRTGTGVEGTLSGTQNGDFQDHMSREGETSNIPHIIMLMYGSIVPWCWLAVKLTSAPWYAMPAGYFVGLLAFYWWHYFTHLPWTGRMFTDHMYHHLISNPPNHFYGVCDDPVQVQELAGLGRFSFLYFLDIRHSLTSNINDLMHIALPLFIVALCIGLIIYAISRRNITLTIMVMAQYFVMTIVLNALHKAYHVKNFDFERWQWFRELRSLHYIHHLGDQHHNYAIVNMGIDALFRSLFAVDPLGGLVTLERVKFLFIVLLPIGFLMNIVTAFKPRCLNVGFKHHHYSSIEEEDNLLMDHTGNDPSDLAEMGSNGNLQH